MNVGAIGHIDHGKRTLTAAIRVLAEKIGGRGTELRRVDNAPGEGARDDDRGLAHRVRDPEPPLRPRRLPRPRRLHQEHDHRRGADGRRHPRNLAADGPMPQTREHMLLARQVGVPYIVVFLNKVDLVDDPELIELVELEELLVVDHVDLVEEHDECGPPTWRASRMCSRVCGIGLSAAPTTRDTAPSVCTAPVIMFLT